MALYYSIVFLNVLKNNERKKIYKKLGYVREDAEKQLLF
jgi:hypothetical protein